MNNYILIGDSITYGIGDYNNNGWASMFKNYILSKDDTKECSNYVHIIGFPGATSKTILNRISYIYNAFQTDDFKNTIILSIGVNDTQEFNGSNRVSFEEYKANIGKIINYILNNNIDLIVLGLTRIESNEKFYWKPNKYYNNEVIIEYDRFLKDYCNSKNIKYISMSDVLESSDYIDGLHPNNNGHNKIYNRLIESINL